jgi:hypothetical protein
LSGNGFGFCDIIIGRHKTRTGRYGKQTKKKKKRKEKKRKKAK